MSSIWVPDMSSEYYLNLLGCLIVIRMHRNIHLLKREATEVSEKDCKVV